jgi:hypothetical protein
MRRGNFINQKLGKRMSRKYDLLKSELAGHTTRKSTRGKGFGLAKDGIPRKGKPPVSD